MSRNMTRFKLPMLAAAALLTLSGCSNDPNAAGFGQMLKSMASGVGKTQAPGATPKVQLSEVLRQTAPTPVIYAGFKKRNNAQSLLLEIQNSGGHQIFATTDRKTLTMKQGMVVATRGLADDLMSASVGQSLSLIRARRSGTAQRDMYHLNGAGESLRVTLSCKINVSGSDRVKQGVIDRATTTITETCSAAEQQFTNTYQVDNAGMIVASSQWLSPILGHADISVLRP